jgi:prepilin-type N-terminal cleavage/methylation domain-containing protein
MKKITKPNLKDGFTIIEVVLVLAIAGLIFLMVFIALPALQRSQRDTQRKDDAARVLSQITNYQSNNRGNVPDSDADMVTLVNNYLTSGGDSFEDPSTGDTYNLTCATVTNPDVANCASNIINSDSIGVGNIYVVPGYICDGDNVPAAGVGRKVAVVIGTEDGGNYCVDNR